MVEYAIITEFTLTYQKETSHYFIILLSFINQLLFSIIIINYY